MDSSGHAGEATRLGLGDGSDRRMCPQFWAHLAGPVLRGMAVTKAGVRSKGASCKKAKDTRAHNLADSVAWLTAQKLVARGAKDDRSKYQLATAPHGQHGGSN